MTPNPVSADELLDGLVRDAFSLLQHDTGPQDPEHRWAEDKLRAKFKARLAALRQGRQAAPVLTDDMLRYAMAAMGTGDPSDAEKFRTFWFHVAPLLAQGKEAQALAPILWRWADADKTVTWNVGSWVTLDNEHPAYMSKKYGYDIEYAYAQPPSAPSAIPAGHLTELVAKWRDDILTYPSTPTAIAVACAVKLCAHELEAALSAQPVANEGEV